MQETSATLSKDAAQEKVTSEQGCPQAEPQKEHQWLQKFLGEWKCQGEAPSMEPGKPPMSWEADETVRALGSLWVIGEGRGQIPSGGESLSVITLGYDAQKKRFVGSFVASMMTNIWVYDGVLDEAGTTLTLDTEGPSMSGDGGIAKYQDVIEFESDDVRTLTSKAIGPDGQWQEFMKATYTRKK